MVSISVSQPRIASISRADKARTVINAFGGVHSQSATYTIRQLIAREGLRFFDETALEKIALALIHEHAFIHRIARRNRAEAR